MSTTLSAIVEAGGDFITRAASGGTISSGVTGTILTLTPPSGQRVRLTHLSTTAGVSQTGISVATGASTIISNRELNGDSPIAFPDFDFSVGNYQPYSAGSPPSGNYHQFTGKTDEVLTLIKNAGNTTVTIYYGYEFGL